MKLKKICFYFLIIAILLTTAAPLYAEPKIPPATARFYCNDFADIIDKSTEDRINELGEEVNRSTGGGQIVFASVSSLDGYTIEEYANEMYNKWKIGTKDKGVLFLVDAVGREARIEVGYGLEGMLTDIQSYRLLEKFAEVNEEEGMEKAVATVYTDICRIVTGQSVELPERGYGGSSSKKEADITDIIRKNPLLIIIIAVLILLDLILTRGRITGFLIRIMILSGRRGGGGNSGGGGRSGGGGASGRF